MDRGYVNARVRGMRSRIVSNDFIIRLIDDPDIESLIDDLELSYFREDIERSSLLYSGINCVEQALRRNITRNFQKLFSLVEGKEWESLIEIFLSKWDIANLKTIIRSKKIHARPDEVLECLVPAGSLDEATLIELNREPDVRSVINLLATWRIKYAIPLTRTMKDIKDSTQTFLLEYALDHYYYDRALSLLSKETYDNSILRDLIKTEIDLVNLKSLLILARDKISPADAEHIYIEGGNQTKRIEFLRILENNLIDDLVEYCKKTGYGLFQDISRDSILLSRVSAFEREIDRFLVKKGVSCAYNDPLSIGLPLSYLWEKFNEVTNIRIIAWCKETGLTDEQVREELVYV